MSELIERMARALCAYNGCDPDELAPDHMMEKGRVQAGDPPRRWEDWQGNARAALAAAREPTEGMEASGRVAMMESVSSPGAEFDADAITHIWQAMIDAALAEGQG